MTESEYVAHLIRGMYAQVEVIDRPKEVTTMTVHMMDKACQHLENYLDDDTLISYTTGAEHGEWRDALARGRAWLEENDAR